MRQLRVSILAICTLITSIDSAFANDVYPHGLSVVLRVGGSWSLFVAMEEGKNLQKIETVSEPRTPTVCISRGQVAYVSASGALREITLKDANVANDVVLLEPNDEVAYTQPAYGSDCDSLLIVELKEGKSVDTDIVQLNDGKLTPVVTQRSAQFEPFFNADGWLYYGNVSCVVSCEQIIQEIWRKHLISGLAEQLTLANSVSREPVATADGGFVYYSGNRAGHYHVWRLEPKKQTYVQLTDGAVVDSAPSIASDGSIYFLRKTASSVQLLFLRKGDIGESALQSLALPQDVEAARDLAITPW